MNLKQIRLDGLRWTEAIAELCCLTPTKRNRLREVTIIFNDKLAKAQNNSFQMPHQRLYNGEVERLLPERLI